MNDNPFLPALARLAEVRDLATGIKLFRCEFIDKGAVLHYQPGQFGFLSAIGVGEAPFGLAVSEARSGGFAEFAVQRIGTVTDALHEMQPGDLVGVRGPMGNCFPMEQLKGNKRIIILGGGIGLAPLRPVIQEILDHRDEYGPLELFCAARTPELLVFREEFAEWGAAPRTTMHVTVDKATDGWTGQVGLITQVLAQVAPSPDNAGRDHLRTADHDQVRAQGAGPARVHGRAGDHDPREQDEMRARQVRPLQRWGPVHLPGRAGLSVRPGPAVSRSVLGYWMGTSSTRPGGTRARPRASLHSGC